MKKGQKFFSKSYHRYVYFEGTRFSRVHGCVIYMFSDICDVRIEIKESDLASDLDA